MIKNKTIFIPFRHSFNLACDYQKQTCLILAKKNHVVAVMQKDSIFLLKKLFIKKQQLKYPRINHISFYQPIYLLPFRRFRLIDKINQIINLCFVYFKFALKRDKILWIFDPEFYFYLKIKFKSLISIYDCVDYQSHLNLQKNKIIKTEELKLIKNCDIFFTNSNILNKIHCHIRKADAVVPQGFRLNQYKSTFKTNIKLKNDKPLIGFIGSINHRLDFSLLQKLIKSNQNYSFIFIGPIQNTEQDKEKNIQKMITKLQQFNNVKIIPYQISTKEVPDLIRQFDIGIIPYDIKQEFVKYSYPMKLFEYFYLGKPVISTPIEELKQINDLIKIAKTAKEWQLCIQQLLSQPWPIKNQQRQKKLALANSWQKKIEAMSKVIEQYYLLHEK